MTEQSDETYQSHLKAAEPIPRWGIVLALLALLTVPAWVVAQGWL